VDFSQARGIVILIERGATIAWAMQSIRVAEGIAAREMTRETFRPQWE
jgi:hypothetical protein